MKKILRYSGSLSLPVKPYSSCAVMDMISAVYDIYRCMHFYAADLRTVKILFVINMMDMIVFYYGKNPAEMSHYARLSAVMDITPPYDMRSYCLLRPSLCLRLHDIIALRLGAVLSVSCRPFIIVFRLQVFSKCDTRASGIAYLTVFYDPAF